MYIQLVLIIDFKINFIGITKHTEIRIRDTYQNGKF